MRRGDNAPVSQTCPLIDEVISTIHSACDRISNEASELPETAREVVMSYLDELSELAQGRNSVLERIRSANDELRRWGNDEYEQARNAESERDALQRQVETLTDDVADLKRELDEVTQ